MCAEQCSFKIDTGADMNVIGKTTYHSLDFKPKLDSTNIVLKTPGGKMTVLGHFQTVTSKDGIPLKIYVVENDTDNLLSRVSACAMNLVKRVNTVQFGQVKCEPVKIQLKENAVPYAIAVARRVPIPLREKVEAELKRMQEGNIIQEITEATDWCAGVVPVLKPNGKVRLCVDLKKLNQAVKRERYIIPTMDDVIHKLKGSSIFSKLDLDSGFWQIP